MIELDDIDRQLLAEMQRDSSRTADQLAEAIGRSPSVIARRLRGLKANGAIQREVAVLSPQVSGNQISTLVRVYLERHETSQAKALREELVASPQVQWVLDTAGELDMVLLVVTRDFEAFDEFADSILEGSPAVRRFESHIVKKRHKATLALPL
ncbi:Lrp/AsnC family transcriptional regulator [Qipengyuania sphaerica]|uniref:Lrp/AsnC family transcriptional regulator n=1 Tax=Qipengyuania sphaerica TaxID=2867243 RepID=UPI001C8950C5|nr:Lrp/AsnC family transcriptional regulator [Qipengyuania sphaerica]MBX7542097.1 Lrp/AsnC family transcriptional regulator [Qipengyuania sphaerica]